MLKNFKKEIFSFMSATFLLKNLQQVRPL